jgi:hypothetical protein
MVLYVAEHEIHADIRFRVRLHPVDISEILAAVLNRLYGKRGNGTDIG